MAAMAKVMSSRAAVLNRSGWKIAVCRTSLGETDWGSCRCGDGVALTSRSGGASARGWYQEWGPGSGQLQGEVISASDTDEEGGGGPRHQSPLTVPSGGGVVRRMKMKSGISVGGLLKS